MSHRTGEPALATDRPGQGRAGQGSAGQGTVAGLLSLCLGFFVIQLDVTIVNVALPAMQRSVGGSLGGLQWVVDAYTLGLASVMLTAGSEADRLGARRLFTAGLGVFGVASAVCAAAPTLGVLIAARAVQGLGAAAMLPCSLALIAHQFPEPRARARALGVWGGTASVGVALGPVLGGGLVALTGWRTIFLVNVPVCAVTIWLLRRHVAESDRDTARHADLRGLLLGVAALAALSGGFITAGQRGWLAPLPGGLLAAGVVLAGVFTWAERRQPAPMLPLGMFRSRNLSAATFAGLLFNLNLYGVLLCLSLYLQQGRHESALATGLLLLPMSLAVGAGSLASGPVTARLGSRPPMVAGFAVAAAGAALLAATGPGTTLPLVVAASLLIGLISLAMPAMTAVAVGAAGRRQAGLASGILNAARQAGGALGVAVLGALFASSRAGGHGPALRLPLAVATIGFLAAAVLTLTVIETKTNREPPPENREPPPENREPPPEARPQHPRSTTTARQPTEGAHARYVRLSRN